MFTLYPPVFFFSLTHTHSKLNTCEQLLVLLVNQMIIRCLVSENVLFLTMTTCCDTLLVEQAMYEYVLHSLCQRIRINDGNNSNLSTFQFLIDIFAFLSFYFSLRIHLRSFLCQCVKIKKK